jgi:REP element-mobilizing transposase RayT
MSHTFTNLLYHVVFSTKDREPFIDAELEERLWPYMGGIVRNIEGTPIEINGTKDHVHLLIELPPTITVAKAVGTIKANATGWVHDTWRSRAHFSWQEGYGAFSVSRSNRDSVVEYIRNQKEHHRTMHFKKEFITLLRKHDVAFDERTIWE